MLFSVLIPVVFAVCWGAFFVTWIIGALYNLVNGPKIVRRSRYSWRWLLTSLLGIILFRFALNSANNAHVAFWPTLIVNVPELQVAGAILLIVSTLFTLWSRLTLGRMWLSTAAVKVDHQLHTDGPYGITRHPIYTGLLGMLVGTALVFLIALPALAISLVVFLSKISNEEKLMTEQFGEQYTKYKCRVPKLVPGL